MDTIDRLHQDLRMNRLNPTWAKAEIFLGLLSAAVGLVAAVAPPALLEGLGVVATLGGIVLMVFGGYLAMAGHRSHIYQSQNRLFAWLADEVRTQR